MSENPTETEVPVTLLSEALIDLRVARGNPEATREAAIRYFRKGVAGGFQVGSLLNWLFFWPNQNDSVFWQLKYPGNEGREFVEMLRNLSVQELGVDTQRLPPSNPT